MVKDVVISTLQTHLYSKLPFGDLKSFVRRYKKDSLVMFFWGQPRGGWTAVCKGSWGNVIFHLFAFSRSTFLNGRVSVMSVTEKNC